MSESLDVSSLTLNRLTVYLRCLRHLAEQGVERISSKEFSHRYQLSPAQFRKDLAHFGEFGIRGVGYDVGGLIDRLSSLLGLDNQRALVVVGVGNLGRALARYFGANERSFRVVGGVDVDPARIGQRVGDWRVQPASQLAALVSETGAEIGVLTVPAQAAQENYEALADAGIKAVLNFAPVRLVVREGIHTRNVDIRIFLEELGFYLSAESAEPTSAR